MIKLLFLHFLVIISSYSFANNKKTLTASENCRLSFIPNSNFQTLLHRLKTNDPSLQKKPSDTILYEDEYFIIKPTLGSVVPLYLLFIPKKPFFNFAQTAAYYKIQPIPLITRILSENFNFNGDFVWFEHGATTSGAVVGSDIDHGHIHIILNPQFTLKSFLNKPLHMDSRMWQIVRPETAYDNKNWEKDYLAFGANRGLAFWAYLETPKISQFFRRAVAELVGKGSEWNYREFSHYELVEETILFMNRQSEENPSSDPLFWVSYEKHERDISGHQQDEKGWSYQVLKLF